MCPTGQKGRVRFFFFFLKYLFIYLAVLGLSYGMQHLLCGMWDLSLQRVGSVVAAHGLSSCGAQA